MVEAPTPAPLAVGISPGTRHRQTNEEQCVGMPGAGDTGRPARRAGHPEH